MALKPLKNISINILMVIMSVFLTLLVLEAVFRVLDIRGYHEPRINDWLSALVPRARLLRGVRLQFRPKSQFDSNYDSNPRGYFNENNGLTYKINNHGFRGPDYEIQKSPNTKRIIVLGDSFTFGEGVKVEHIFSSQLQKNLGKQNTNSVEVLNFGVSAWGTHDEINYCKHVCAKHEPDLIIVVFVLNDADYAGGLDLWEDFRTKYEKQELKKSYLASYVYSMIARQTYGKKYIDGLTKSTLRHKEKWDKTLAYLKEGKQVADRIGAKYAVVIFPFMYELNEGYPFRSIHQMVSEYSSDNGIPVLDLFDSFDGMSYTELWVHPSDQHPNEIGHKISADSIAEFIRRKDLLSKHE
jgi:lysophospholipase L1-like esterase